MDTSPEQGVLQASGSLMIVRLLAAAIVSAVGLGSVSTSAIHFASIDETAAGVCPDKHP